MSEVMREPTERCVEKAEKNLAEDERTAQVLEGWKSLNMSQRYAHVSQQHRLEAMELPAENSPTLFPPVLLELRKDELPDLLVVHDIGRQFRRWSICFEGRHLLLEFFWGG